MQHTRNLGRWQLLTITGLLLYIALASVDVTSFEQGENNRNVSIDTRVNITNSIPEILLLTIGQGEEPPFGNLSLSPGTSTLVYCNVSVRDFNGGATVASANATFYHSSSGSSDPDDNNTHYTNDTCEITSTSGNFRNFTCSFPVQYYANVGFWDCNATVQDDHPFNTSRTNTTHVNQLLAINVTTLIDYGNLAVGDISTVQQANVSNIGNIHMNVSLKGYGHTLDDGLSFNCTVGNISVEYEKFNITDNGQQIANYTNLSSTLSQIPGLTVVQRTNDSAESLNTTYWVLEVPPNPSGTCNGTIIFQAELSA